MRLNDSKTLPLDAVVVQIAVSCHLDSGRKWKRDAMQLFYSPTSPYARNVLLAIDHHAMGEKIDLKTVNPLDDPEALRAANPLGKVPALVLDDGRVLYDSTTILHVLNETGAATNLFESDHLAKFEPMRLYALANGILDLAVAWRLESTRPENEQSNHWQQRRLRGIEQALAEMAQVLPEKSTLQSIIEISYGVSLDYLTFRLGFLNWQNSYPALAEWVEPILLSRPFTDTDPRKV
jgi:glutathione S-transferase